MSEAESSDIQFRDISRLVVFRDRSLGTWMRPVFDLSTKKSLASDNWILISSSNMKMMAKWKMVELVLVIS